MKSTLPPTKTELWFPIRKCSEDGHHFFLMNEGEHTNESCRHGVKDIAQHAPQWSKKNPVIRYVLCTVRILPATKQEPP